MKLVWYDANAENPPWIKALAEVRHRGTREGYCFQHVQAIMLAIDQYAETALGTRLSGRPPRDHDDQASDQTEGSGVISL
jgi:hypothetical protein